MLQGSQEAVRDKVKVNVGWLNTYGASHASGYAAPKTSNPAWPKIRVARRFGAALVLHDIMQEVSSNQASTLLLHALWTPSCFWVPLSMPYLQHTWRQGTQQPYKHQGCCQTDSSSHTLESP